jgi:hypothetical protein
MMARLRSRPFGKGVGNVCSLPLDLKRIAKVRNAEKKTAPVEIQALWCQLTSISIP